MIEGDFRDLECAKAIRFSGDQFEFVVETLHGAAGNGLFRTKPIEQKPSVRTKQLGQPSFAEIPNKSEQGPDRPVLSHPTAAACTRCRADKRP